MDKILKKIGLVLTVLSGLIRTDASACGMGMIIEPNDRVSLPAQYIKGCDYRRIQCYDPKLQINRWLNWNGKIKKIKSNSSSTRSQSTPSMATIEFDEQGLWTHCHYVSYLKGKNTHTDVVYTYIKDTVSNSLTRTEIENGKVKNVLTWNDKDLLIKEAHDTYTSTYFYAPDNRILSIHSYSADSLSSIDTFIYNAEGRCLRQIYDCSNGKKELSLIVKYDEHGFEYRRAYYSVYDDIVDIDDGYTYHLIDGFVHYNEPKQRKNAYTYYPDGKLKTMENYYKFVTYNENGDETLRVEDNLKGYKSKSADTTRYKYNKDHQLVEEVSSSVSEYGRIYTHRYIINYENGVMKSKKKYYNDKDVSLLEEQFDYDEKGNPIKYRRWIHSKNSRYTDKYKYTFWK